MEKQLFLSFIVPVYNVEKYLEECLDSLLEQDIPHEEYEIICVNDGSTDGSLEILRRYEEKYPNIRVIDQENGGLSAARNVGLVHAKGEYIWFVDSDDLVQNNCLLELQRISVKEKCDRINFGTYEFYDTLSQEECKQAKDHLMRANTYLYNVVVWNNLFRLSNLQNTGLKFRYPETRHSEDGIFMFEYMLTKPSEVIIDKVCYYYRRRPQSLTTSSSLESHRGKIRSYRIIVKALEKYYHSAQGDEIHIANLLMSNLWTLMYSIVHLPIKEACYEIGRLKKENLFPFSRPTACTLVKSYQTTRTDIVGKVFDKIYINLHTRTGFFCMRVWKMIEKVKHRLEGRP